MYQSVCLDNTEILDCSVPRCVHVSKKRIDNTKEGLKLYILYKGMSGWLSETIDGSFPDEKLPLFLLGSFSSVFLSRGRCALVFLVL